MQRVFLRKLLKIIWNKIKREKTKKNFKMGKQTRVGTSVVIISKSNQILLGKRKGSHGEGMYAIPGGHLEFNESYTQCCDRELMEEIGINFGKYEPVGFSEDWFKVNDKEDRHYTTLYFVVKDVDSNNISIKNMEPDKCEEWKWIHINNLPENLFCDSYNQIKSLFVLESGRVGNDNVRKDIWRLK